LIDEFQTVLKWIRGLMTKLLLISFNSAQQYFFLLRANIKLNKSQLIFLT